MSGTFLVWSSSVWCCLLPSSYTRLTVSHTVSSAEGRPVGRNETERDGVGTGGTEPGSLTIASVPFSSCRVSPPSLRSLGSSLHSVPEPVGCRERSGKGRRRDKVRHDNSQRNQGRSRLSFFSWLPPLLSLACLLRFLCSLPSLSVHCPPTHIHPTRFAPLNHSLGGAHGPGVCNESEVSPDRVAAPPPACGAYCEGGYERSGKGIGWRKG